MNKNKPQGYKRKEKYKKYLSKNGASDIWARELLNGMFEIDDTDWQGSVPYIIPAEQFLDCYEIYDGTN